jgi:hypothetical protein
MPPAPPSGSLSASSCSRCGSRAAARTTPPHPDVDSGRPPVDQGGGQTDLSTGTRARWRRGCWHGREPRRCGRTQAWTRRSDGGTDAGLDGGMDAASTAAPMPARTRRGRGLPDRDLVPRTGSGSRRAASRSPATRRRACGWAPTARSTRRSTTPCTASSRAPASITAFATQPTEGTGFQGLDFGPDGNLYVAARTSANVILRFDGTTGAFIDVFASMGINGPNTPRFGPDGRLYVSCRNTGNVVRFSTRTGRCWVSSPRTPRSAAPRACPSVRTGTSTWPRAPTRWSCASTAPPARS